MAFVWSGPDQWLACKVPAPAEGMEALLAAPFAGLASLVDQSHGRTLLRVTGPHVRDALAKGVAVDLHPRAFKTGDQPPPWSPISPCSCGRSTTGRPTSLPWRAAWRKASGTGSRHRPPNTGSSSSIADVMPAKAGTRASMIEAHTEAPMTLRGPPPSRG